MVSKKQFHAALNTIAEYEQQLRSTVVTNITTEVGCRVKLSKFGLEMQGEGKRKLIGTTIEYIPWIVNPEKDGTVYVKWDSRKKPYSMHIGQIEAIKDEK